MQPIGPTGGTAGKVVGDKVEYFHSVNKIILLKRGFVGRGQCATGQQQVASRLDPHELFLLLVLCADERGTDLVVLGLIDDDSVGRLAA